ncbi:hypothetical protein SAMN05443633_1133 [Chryseobacterium arachidis]|uniref:Uncharacterized protein n=1 Tax=Chryseobacterium arachidis TaxID=1416778 RepID=A0A1M5ILV5_9FLAO|nr:hypothetical protein [Chryseobacterium arachidis]SHG29292.1 hypothetical protein SAMN05443633_1133 [Chryseobacterium arachidis]
MNFHNIITQLKIFTVKSILVVIFTISYHLLAQTRSITVTGTWAPTIPAITEAGNNYLGTYESATNQVLITAAVPALSTSKISVHYLQNPTWNSSLILSVKRTGTGGSLCIGCSMTGGNTAYIPVPLSTSVDFFSIISGVSLSTFSNIPIQIQLSGVSVTIPSGNYNSRLVFTIGP